MSTLLIRLMTMAIILLIITLLYARRDTNDAQRDVQHLSDTIAYLLNGGAVLVGDDVMRCKVTQPIQLVSGL